MNMQDIVVIAGRHGVAAGNMNKMDLIRAIQRAEGYADCFMTNVLACGQANCLWHGDCLQGAQENSASAMLSSSDSVETASAPVKRKRATAQSATPKKTKTTTKKRT